MSIYTKTGDKGMTSLWGGKKVSKADLQVEAYGSCDELTSYLGLVIAKLKDKQDKQLLTTIQKDLYQIMAFLSNAKLSLTSLNSQVKSFEQYIDKLMSQLPELHRFILPQGGETASLLQISRTICRKAERRVIAYFSKVKTSAFSPQTSILQYLNRLSDLLFMLARKYEKKEVLT